MADDPADGKPLHHAAANHHHHNNNSHRLTAPSLSAPLKLDEGYSDESRSPLDRAANDVMSLPDWLLAQSETDRAELAYSLLRTLRTSSLAAIVDRVTPLLHMDPVLKLPPEITFEIFAYLDPQTLLTASLASRAWRDRVCDPRLWRDLYTTEGWRIDIDAVRAYEDEHSRLPAPQSRKSRSRYADSDLGEPKHKKRVPPTWLDSRVNDLLEEQTGGLAEADPEGDHVMSDASADRPRPPATTSVVDPEDNRIASPETSRTMSNGRTTACQHPPSPTSSPLLLRMPNGAAKINWLYLYRQRRRLEENWAKGRFTNFQLPHPAHMDECHQDFVYTIQFSGRWLVSGSRDKTIRVWDLTTQRLWYPPLVGHTKSVLCLQFGADADEDIIVSGGSDMSVIVWRFSTGEKLHQIARAHDDSVLNLQYDKRYLVTGSKDKLIKVWNRTTLIPTDKDYPQVHHSSGVSYPAYIIDTSEVPSPVLEDNLARSQIQPLAPFSLLMTLAGHSTAVNAIQMGETEIVSASGDRMIKVWNLRNGTCLKTLGGHKKGIACVQFDGRRIISGGNDNSVRIFDHASGAEVACLQGHDNLVRTVQAGFGDPPGAEEAMRLEALAIENNFFDAQRAGADVDLGPRAMRRAGYRQDTTGSRNPRDINALGARIPPGGGGSRWARIVSGSYDENVIVWKKDKRHRWTASQKLSYKAAVENAQATPSRSSSSSRRSSRDRSRIREARPRPEVATQTQRHGHGERGRDRGRDRDRHRERERERHADRPHRHQHHHPPRVFKLQFDARKIICGSTDPIIVGWDFADLDEDLREASQFFTSL